MPQNDKILIEAATPKYMWRNLDGEWTAQAPPLSSLVSTEPSRVMHAESIARPK